VIPAGIAASWRLPGVSLLEATEAAVPAAFVLGLAAVSLARRARYRVERSVGRKGERLARAARALAWAAVYLAVSGGVALGFYGLLVLRG
jgi:hypothetical protein